MLPVALSVLEVCRVHIWWQLLSVINTLKRETKGLQKLAIDLRKRKTWRALVDHVCGFLSSISLKQSQDFLAKGFI